LVQISPFNFHASQGSFFPTDPHLPLGQDARFSFVFTGIKHPH